MSEGDARGGHGASLRDYLRVVRRRKWIILQAVLLVPAVAVGLSLRQEKVYKATSQVLLVQQNPADQFNGIPQSGADPADRQAQTQADLARVTPVAQRALALAGLARSSDQFLSHSSAAAKTNSDLLELSVWDHQPQVAIALTKAYAQAFAGYRADLDTAPYETAKARADTQLRAMVLDGGKGSAAYQELQAKRDQLDQYVALLTRNAVPVKLPDQAVQIQPKPVRNGILGLALGLVLGIGLAFLREALDTRVRSAEEVGEKLGLPLLARVPEPPRKLRNSNRLVMMAEPHGVQAEAFRTLRTNIEFVNLDTHARTIMITSAIQAEGKSTTAANLAIAFARMGKRVALVDLDLRRPFLDKFFNFGDRPGLTHVARGHFSIEAATLHVALTPDDDAERVAVPADANGQRDERQRDKRPRDPGRSPRRDLVGATAAGWWRLRRQQGRGRPHRNASGSLRPGADRLAAALARERRNGAEHTGRRNHRRRAARHMRQPILKELGRVLDGIRAPKLGYVATGLGSSDEDYAYQYRGSYSYDSPKSDQYEKVEA